MKNRIVLLLFIITVFVIGIILLVVIRNGATRKITCPGVEGTPAIEADDFELNRWDTKLSEKFSTVSESKAQAKGCLSCHDGIMDINPKMQEVIDAIATAFGNPNKGYGCVICHQGNAEATTKKEAHKKSFPIREACGSSARDLVVPSATAKAGH